MSGYTENIELCCHCIKNWCCCESSHIMCNQKSSWACRLYPAGISVRCLKKIVEIDKTFKFF